MLVFVIAFNLLLTLLNLYIAIRLWQLRRVLARMTRTLTLVERRIHKIFYPAPEIVFKGQQGTYALRLHYQRFLLQLELMGQISSFFSLGVRIWRHQLRKKRHFQAKKRFLEW
jgi:hypothetical protein